MRSDEELDAIISLIYEAALDPACWTRVMEMLADGFGSAQATLAMVDVKQPQNAIVRVTRFDPAAEADYLRRRDKEDVWWQRLQVVETGQCFTGSELIDTKQFLKATLTKDVRRTTDIAFMLGGWYQKSGDVLGFLSVLRGLSSDDFSRDEKALLGRILPHVRRAMSIHRRFGEITQRAHQLESGLNNCADAIFIVDNNGRISISNKAAEGILQRQCGVGARAGYLTLDDREAQCKMDNALRQHVGVQTSGLGEIRARRKAMIEPLAVRIFPIANARADILLGGEHFSAVVINEPTRTSSPSLEILTAFYGLTRAEAKIAKSIVDGKRLADIAEFENRSIHTVRTQLRACFSRLGVKSQAELVRHLSSAER